MTVPCPEPACCGAPMVETEGAEMLADLERRLLEAERERHLCAAKNEQLKVQRDRALEQARIARADAELWEQNHNEVREQRDAATQDVLDTARRSADMLTAEFARTAALGQQVLRAERRVAELEVGVQHGLEDLAAEARELEAVREHLAAAERQRDEATAALGEMREVLSRLTGLLSQDGGWCNHGVLMDRPYHPRCSHCVLNQARVALAASPVTEGD